MAEDDGWTEVSSKPKRGGGGDGGYPGTRQQPQSAPRGGPIGRRDQRESDRKVIVKGLTQSTNENMLRAAMKSCGRIEEVSLCREASGESRGFAFVTFYDPAAAVMAVRNGVRVDSKPCIVDHARPRDEQTRQPGAASGSSKGSSEAQEVQDFVNRHEFSEEMRQVLFRTNPKVAVRVVRQLDATGGLSGYLSEPMIHAELAKIARSGLSFELERRANDWVQSLWLHEDTRDRVQSVLLGQRSEEIEHILEMSSDQSWTDRLCKASDPPVELLRCVRRYRKDELQDRVAEFCWRFGFGAATEQKLGQLTAEKARRLMEGWRPASSTGASQKQLQQDFLIRLEQAVAERKHFEQERWQRGQDVSAVASHARIMEDWSNQRSDEEDEDDNVGTWQDGGSSGSTYYRQRKRSDDDNLVFDDWLADDNKEHSASFNSKAMLQRGSAGGSGPQHFNIASTGNSQPSGTLQSGSMAKQIKKRQPKPTHFIMCVDTSGSMLTQDCKSESGRAMTRQEAVLETCSQFVTGSVMNREDVYSFITFNEESVLHFSCQKAFSACEQLGKLAPKAEKQTLFAMGIRGIEAAAKRDKNGLPAHVVFLSDGDPTDPKVYLKDLTQILRKRPTLKIYAIGFGESAKVNAREGDFPFLQQLASMGRGHFQRCGASLASLQGAFTAVTSTISRTRESTGRKSTSEREIIGAPTPQKGSASAGDGFPGRSSEARPSGLEETIQEADEEEDSDEESDADPQRHEALAQSREYFNKVDFEMPTPHMIFKDTSDSSLWKNFMAAKTSFKFDGRTFKRSAEVSRVFLRKKPFMQGGMRLVYGMVLEKGKDNPFQDENTMCAKRQFADLQKDHGFQAHAAFCRSTAVAQYYAAKFRKATEEVMKKKVQIGFLDCHLYSPVGSDEDGYHFCGEKYLKGHFVKLNSNAGYVNETEYGEHSAIAQAFSHFTYDRSRAELLVVDLQGICGEGEGRHREPYSLLTDPQVHSLGAFERFGSGDLGESGVTAFFRKHRCGEICQALKLRKDPELRKPTHLFEIPGIQSCIDALPKLVPQIRKTAGFHAISLPKQVSRDRDWMEVSIWAAAKSGDKAKQLFKEHLEVLYTELRQVISLSPRLNWSVEKLQEKLQGWRTASGAAIIPYPPDWTSTGILELWVFSESDASGWTDHRNARWALKQIEEELGSLAGRAQDVRSSHQEVKTEAPQGDVTATTDVSEVTPEWSKNCDSKGNPFWQRKSDSLWFWETDEKWQRFVDDQSNRYWWWNSETGIWFFET